MQTSASMSLIDNKIILSKISLQGSVTVASLSGDKSKIL